jgi:hypothetical protein
MIYFTKKQIYLYNSSWNDEEVIACWATGGGVFDESVEQGVCVCVCDHTIANGCQTFRMLLMGERIIYCREDIFSDIFEK